MDTFTMGQSRQGKAGSDYTTSRKNSNSVSLWPLLISMRLDQLLRNLQSIDSCAIGLPILEGLHALEKYDDEQHFERTN